MHGDWGLGIGDFNPQSTIPNPQSKIKNSQSPIPKLISN